MLEKEKFIPIAAGSLFVLLLAALIYTSPDPIVNFLTHVENIDYDLRLRKEHKPVLADSPVVIVDIDDESLKKEGRWPWKRNRLADLVSELYRLGAKVIAFDIIFPEAEENIAQEVINGMKQANSAAIGELEAARSLFDYDQQFAQALGTGNGVLGFVFNNGSVSVGELPHPALALTTAGERELPIAEFKGYLANIAPLQDQAKGEGFINSTHDSDGIVRFSPLILKYKESIYPSLALETTRLFLSKLPIELIVEKYGKQDVLEGIRLGERRIATDPWGRILIPFRGPPFSIPYISAADVLEKKVQKEKIDGRLVFIGSSATAMGDLYATSMAPVFPGIEIHAQIATSILDGYMPYKPNWTKGAQITLLLCVGLLSAFLLPFLGPIRVAIFGVLMIGALLGFDHWIWAKHKIVLSSAFSIIVVLLLVLFNEIFGFFSEKERRIKLKSIFNQYVPSERVDTMSKSGEEFTMDGETKKLSVLFADIRNFTSFSENLSATELKDFLNRFFTDMTQVIFDHKGTIDKYIGDLVMAFWGAPVDDPNHEIDAVKAALDMQKKLKEKYPSMGIGIGVNTGLMNVGDMGSKFRRAYTVLGSAVNTGSRLETATKSYRVGILVGEETWEKTKEMVAYKKIDRVRLVGKHKAIDIYEPVCLVGEESSKVKEEIALHEKGMEEYFKQNWDGAETAFRALQKSTGQEVYSLYLSRIQEYRTKPPGANWDGVFSASVK